MATNTIPKIEDHTAPFFSINIAALLPNFADKNATIKNLNPREIMQIIKNINILKFISPLVIVKSLKGNGEKPFKPMMLWAFYVRLVNALNVKNVW